MPVQAVREASVAGEPSEPTPVEAQVSTEAKVADAAANGEEAKLQDIQTLLNPGGV